MAKTLTMAAVQKMRPGAERIVVSDAGCPGLSLIIQPSGVKSWQMRFRQPDGSLMRLTLGRVELSGQEATAEPEIGSPLTLAAARRLAADVQHRRAMGHDFKAAKQRQKFAAATAGAKTFGAAAADFIVQHSMRKVRGWKYQARTLGLRAVADGPALEVIPGGLAERWSSRPLDQIDGDDVHALVRECREQGVPGLGRKNPGAQRSARPNHVCRPVEVFAWCVEDRRLRASPMVGVAKPRPPASRDRVLTNQELAWLWKATESVTEPFSACLRLLILTGARRDEIAGMRRSELNGSVWTLPGSRSKNHRAHELALPPLAMEILAGVRTEGDLIFSTTGHTAISGWSKAKIRLDEIMLGLARAERGDRAEIAPWVIHDLRRSAATKMAELGIEPAHIEAVLNHVSGFRAGVAGVYNRNPYGPEKKAALEKWAAHLADMVQA
jgi:hypothetical protein